MGFMGRMVVHHHHTAVPLDALISINMLEEPSNSGNVRLFSNDKLHSIPMVRNAADDRDGPSSLLVKLYVYEIIGWHPKAFHLFPQMGACLIHVDDLPLCMHMGEELSEKYDLFVVLLVIISQSTVELEGGFSSNNTIRLVNIQQQSPRNLESAPRVKEELVTPLLHCHMPPPSEDLRGYKILHNMERHFLSTMNYSLPFQ